MRNLLPKEAWALAQGNPDAPFVDVPMEIEALCIDRPTVAGMDPRYEYRSLQPEPERFVAAMSQETGRWSRRGSPVGSAGCMVLKASWPPNSTDPHSAADA